MCLARAILLVAVFAGASRGGDDSQSRARAHFEIGNGMYRLGDYRGALREFAAGYELTHKPGFLINLGQTYRKLNDLPSARDMYQKYLASTPANDPARAQVQQLLADLEAEIKAQPPSLPEPIPSPAPSFRPPPPPEPAVVVVAAPVKKHNRGMQIGGIVLGLVGVGLVAGGGGAAANAEELAKELNDLDLRRGTFDAAKDDRYHLNRAVEGALFGVGAALTVTGIVLLAVGSR